jgi:TonB family protein
MNGESGAATRWSGQRWITFLIFIALAHLGFIFIFGERQPPSPKRRRPAATSQIASPIARELAAYQDPTLFAVPHPLTFSGLNISRPQLASSNSVVWPDEPYSLQLAAAGLANPIADSSPETRETASLPQEPRVFAQPYLPATFPLPTQSFVRVEGPLRSRGLLNIPNLRTWPRADLVTNTIIGVTVDPAGAPASVVLLSSSGLPEADRAAIQAANRAQFEPAAATGSYAALTAPSNHIAGKMVFEWRTEPTNTLANSNSPK